MGLLHREEEKGKTVLNREEGDEGSACEINRELRMNLARGIQGLKGMSKGEIVWFQGLTRSEREKRFRI